MRHRTRDGSRGYESLEEVTTAVEKAGYTCAEPATNAGHYDETTVSCGWPGGIVWFNTAKDEVDSYTNLDSVHTSVGVPLYAVRGDHFHIMAAKSDMEKIATSMNIVMSVDGAK